MAVSDKSRALIARNFLSLSAGQMVTLLVGLGAGIYSRRILGATVIGQLAWAASVLSYFNLLSNPGLEAIAQRDVARDPTRANEYVSRIVSLQLLLALVSFVGISLLAACNVRGPAISLYLILQGLGLLLTPFNLGWLMRAREQMTPYVLITASLQVLQLPVLFLLVQSPSHVIRFILYPYPFAIVAAGLLFWYAGRQRLLDFSNLHLSLKGATALLREAMPLGLSQMAGVLYFNSDAIFLGFMRGDATVGFYSTAYRLWSYAVFPFSTLSQAYFPAFARANADTHTAQRISAEFSRVLLWFGLPLAAVCWAVGRNIVHLFYGSRFDESGPLFEWLSLNIALSSFTWSIAMPLNAWGQQRKSLYITMSAALTNVGLNFIVIPRYGAPGAVATTLLAEFVALVSGLAVRRKVHPIPWMRLSIKPLVTAAVVAIVAQGIVLVVPHFWWIALLTGCAIAAGSLWFFERQILTALVKSLTDRGRNSSEQ